jgi:plastocyanin
MHAISRTIVAVVVIVLIFAAASGYLYAYPPASSKSTVATSLETFTNFGVAPATSTNTTTATTSANAVYVYIPNDGGYPFAQFTPQVITVVIGVNNTVVWTNQDVLVHDILTATGLPGFASGDLATGQTYTYTFTQAGTFPYYCSYHPSHTGVVVVLNAPTA